MNTPVTSKVIRTGRPLRLSNGFNTLEIDVRRTDPDVFEVTLGPPYDAVIRSSVVDGCRRFHARAPLTTIIERVPA